MRQIDAACLHYRPNDRFPSVVVVLPNAIPAVGAKHLNAAAMHARSQDELNAWLRTAVCGTPLVLHLSGHETLACARRLAWFVETCRRFDIDLAMASAAVTPGALELLHALGADIVRFDDAFTRDWRGKAVVQRVRTLAEALHMAA